MVYLFYGENSFAMRQQLKELIERYRQKAGGDFGLERFDAPALETAEGLISALSALPFLAPNRLIIIEDLTQNAELAAQVAAVITNVPDSTVAVVYETKPDKRTSAFKTLKQQAKAVEFKPLAPRQLLAWAQATAQEFGAQLGPAEARFLIDYAGSDQWRLYHELQKVAAYAPQITPETIKALVKPAPAQSVFDLVDALSGGHTARALSLYRQLRGQQEEPLYLLSMLGWHLQNLALAKTAQLPATELAREAKLSPYVAKRAVAQAKSLDLASIKAVFGLLLEADLELKSTATNPDQVMERLLYACTEHLGVAKARS